MPGLIKKPLEFPEIIHKFNELQKMPQASASELHFFKVAGLELFEKIKESYDADKVLSLISAYYAPKAFTDWFQEMRELHETTDEEDLAAENEAMEVHDQQYSSLRDQTRAILIQQTARVAVNTENCDEIIDEMCTAYSRLTLSENEKKTLNLSLNTEQVDLENRQKFIVYVKQSISLQDDIKLLLATAWRYTAELPNPAEAQHLIFYLLEESRVGYSKNGLYLANEKWSCLDGIVDRLLDNMQAVMPSLELNAVTDESDPIRVTFDNLIDPYLYRDQDNTIQPKSLLIALYLESVAIELDIKFELVRKEYIHFELDSSRQLEIQHIADKMIMDEYESLTSNIAKTIPLPLTEAQYEERNNYLTALVKSGTITRIAKGRILQIETNPNQAAHELIEKINASNNPDKWPEIPSEYFTSNNTYATELIVKNNEMVLDDDACDTLFEALANENSRQTSQRLLHLIQILKVNLAKENVSYDSSFIRLLNQLYPLNNLNHFLLHRTLPTGAIPMESVIDRASSVAQHLEAAIILFRSNRDNEYFHCYCISDLIVTECKTQLENELDKLEEADDFYAVAPFCNDDVYSVMIDSLLLSWVEDTDDISEEAREAINEQFEVILNSLFQHAAYWNYPSTWLVIKKYAPGHILDENLICSCFEIACKRSSNELLGLILDATSLTLTELETYALGIRKELFIKSAIQEWQSQTLQFLIARGATINPTGHASEDNPLIIAASQLDTLLIKTLVYLGADINGTNLLGGTALHALAADANQEDNLVIMRIIKFMIAKGADINRRDNYGYTPLQYLRHTLPDEQITRCITQFGAIDLPRSHFEYRHRKKHENLFKYAPVEVLKFCLSSQEQYQKELLNIAIGTKNWENINAFLTIIGEKHFQYAQFNTAPRVSTSPLSLALANNAPAPIIKKLLDIGAKINQLNADGSTALHHVMTLAQIEVMNLEAGMLNCFDHQRATPLYIAIINARWDIARFMLESGANPSYTMPSNSIYPANDSALHHLIARGDLELIALGLENSPTFIDPKTFNLQSIIENHDKPLSNAIYQMLETHNHRIFRLAEEDRLFSLRGTNQQRKRTAEHVSSEDESKANKHTKYDDENDNNKKPKF